AGTDGSRWETAALPRSRTCGAAHTTTSAAVPVDHQAYSPDLAPSDYHLLQLLKRFLAKRYLSRDDDVQTDGCHRLAPLSKGGSLRHRCTEIGLTV
ncbi:hypothetical protein AVEN_180883-1, partial [Araneus ventricosus]